MTKCFVEDTSLTNIANKIREKSGGTDQLIFPTDFISAIDALGGGSGENVWSMKYAGSTATEDTTGGTYTLTTANDSRPSSEIEYSVGAPEYNADTKKWEMADSTIVTLTNEDTTVPSFSGSAYVRLTSAPNVWYLATAINTGGSGPYIKSLAYDAMYTADLDSAVEYTADDDSTKYPDGGWLDGVYYELCPVIFTTTIPAITNLALKTNDDPGQDWGVWGKSFDLFPITLNGTVYNSYSELLAVFSNIHSSVISNDIGSTIHHIGVEVSSASTYVYVITYSVDYDSIADDGTLNEISAFDLMLICEK